MKHGRIFYLCRVNLFSFINNDRPMLRNVGRSLFRPYWPISGDLAAFPGKMDQRTVRRPKCPQIENSGKITGRPANGRSGIPNTHAAAKNGFLMAEKDFLKNYQLFFGN